MEKRDLKFGEALELAQQGYKIAREGWNGKGLYIMFIPGSVIEAKNVRSGIVEELAKTKEQVEILGHFDIKMASNQVSVGWRPTTPDMLGKDWTAFI